MKKGNVEIRKGINQTYRICYADTLLFVLHEDSVKDLHAILSELLETETVKEECRCRSGELKTGGKWASWSKDNCPVHPDKSPFDKEAPTTPEKQKIQCLCPAWFSDGEGGHVKNTRKDHVKGECPLANVENELATPEKKPSEKIGEILCKIMDGYTHPDDVDWNHERVNAVVAYLDEQYKKK